MSLRVGKYQQKLKNLESWIIMYEPIIRLEEFRIMNARAYLYAQRCKTFCAKLHSSENE